MSRRWRRPAYRTTKSDTGLVCLCQPERPKTLSICSVARSPRWYCCRTLRNASRRWVSAPLPVRPRSSPLTSRRNQPNGDGLFARPRSTSTDAFSRADELWRAPRNRGRTDSEGRRRCVLQTHSVTPRFGQSKALLSAVELDVFTVLVDHQGDPKRRSRRVRRFRGQVQRRTLMNKPVNSRQGRPITVECSGVTVTR